MLLKYQHNMSDMYGDTVGNRPRGLAGDTLGNVPSGSPLLFGHFPKCIRYSIKVAEKVQRVANTPLGTSQMVSTDF